MVPMMDLDDDLFDQRKATADSLHSDSDLRDEAFSSATTTVAERTVKFNPKIRINKKINLPMLSKSSASESPSSSKIHDTADDEQVKMSQSEIQATTKSVKASYEFSQLDAPLLHSESSHVHDLNFSAVGLIESLELKARCCDNINDLKAPSLLENEDLQTIEREHTIYHVEESNFEDCTPSIVQNVEAGTSCGKVRQENKLKTSIDNMASIAQNTKNIISEMDDGGYEGDDMPKQKKRKLPRKSHNINCERESSVKHRKKKSDESAPKDFPKKRLPHGSSRCKPDETQGNVEGFLPEDRSQLVIRDLIRLADFKEQMKKKREAIAKIFRDNQSKGHEQNKNDVDVNTTTQQKRESPKLNYHSYLKRPAQTRWSNSDTEVFYQAIKQFGTDFEMIQVLFPDRSRQQVKAKFKNEQRKHPLQIADALVHRSKDHSHFEKVIQHLQALAEEKAKKEASDLAAISPDESDQNEEAKTEAGIEEEQDPKHYEYNCHEDAYPTTKFDDNENDFDQYFEDCTENLM